MKSKKNQAKLFILTIAFCFLLIISLSSISADWGTGGTVTYDGDYVVHTFLVNGTFNVTSGKNITILIIAGGGAGGGGAGGGGGGGGAGGLLYAGNYTLTEGQHNITVGLGGIGVLNLNGGNGKNSSFNSFIAFGGGGGGKDTLAGNVGGSGGGSGNDGGTGGNSNQINYSISGFIGYGKKGGDSSGGGSAGGGGSGFVGQNSLTGGYAGAGGNGSQYNMNGTSLYYAGGGGGAYTHGANGGLGGGGLGGNYEANNQVAGTDGYGGGGGGASGASVAGANGGSGIVIIRYLGNSPSTVSNISWITSGGSTGDTLIYNQMINNITAYCYDKDNNNLVVNVTVKDPTGITVINNQQMSNVTNSTNSTNSIFYYSGLFNLNKAGTWTINVSSYDGYELTYNYSTFEVITLNVSLKDGYYGYSKNNILNQTEITSASTYRYDLYEISTNITNFQTRWNSILQSINYSYEVNAKIGLNYVLDFDLSDSNLLEDVKKNISATLHTLKSDPYYSTIAYISLEVYDQSYDNSTIVSVINNISANITGETGNKFVLYSKNYNNDSLDSSYIKYTTMLYVNDTTESDWIDTESELSQNYSSLNRIYVNPTTSLQSYIYNYQTNVIRKLRTSFNTTVGLTNNTASTINGDVIIFNNQNSNLIRTVNMSKVTSDVGKDFWDSTNKLFIINDSSDLILNVNISAYSATLVFADDLSNILMTSNTQGTLYKASSGSTLSQNWSDGTRDGSWNLDASNDVLIELFDPHYIRNNFMTYYGWLNVSYINFSATDYDVLIFADKNAQEISKLNCTSGKCYGYISVADYTNDETWQNNKEDEVDTWITLNSSMNLFIDGLDLGIGGTNFSVRFKELVDYVRITKGKKAILNTYTAYQDFAMWGDGVMKESCVQRWNGLSAANPDNYTREVWSLELNRSSWFSSHGIPVYCQSFGNKSTNPQMIENYTDLINIYYASKVLGYEYFYLTQPDFGYAWNIFLPDMGEDMSNDWNTDDNIVYYRRYSNGIVYYNSSSSQGWFDNGRTVNDAKICFNLYDANLNSVSFDYNINLFPSIPPSTGQYSIPDTNLTVATWVTICQNVDYSESGRYVIDAFVSPRTTIVGQGISIGYEDVSGTGIHSWYDNTAGAYIWNNYQTGRNWEVSVVVNETTKASIDTFSSGIAQSNQSSVGKYNLTLSSTYPVNLDVYSTVQIFNKPSVNVTNITYYNGSGLIDLNLNYNSSCINNNPSFGITSIDGENYGACYYNNSGIINWRVSVPHLSDKIFILLTDETLPSVDFNYQSPSDINTFNIFGRLLNISYNISGTYLNPSEVKLNFKTNDSINDCIFYVNGISNCGYSYDPAITSNDSDVWLYRLNDNQVYPATYNINETLMESTTHLFETLNSSSHFLKINLLNVSTKYYGIFEIMINASLGTLNSLPIYYCNSSYINGNPSNNSYCTNFYNLDPTTSYNHSHGAISSHMTIPFAVNTTTNKIGNVRVTSNSYFILKGVNNGNWTYYYINQSHRANISEISINEGLTYLNGSYTVDAHLHQYNGTELFYYYACGNDTYGNQNCSSLKYDLLDLAGLPPTSPNIYSPTAETYFNQIVNINYTAAQSPNNYDIVLYNISLVYSNESYVSTLKSNNSLNLSYTFNTSTVDFGNYRIKVEACDNISQCSYGYSDIFTVTYIVLYPIYPLNTTIPNYIANNTINISWNVSDPAGVDNTTLYVFNATSNLTLNQTLITFVPGTINTTIGVPITLVDGRYKWYADVYDASLNYASSTNQTFVLDTVYPTINYTEPTLSPGNYMYNNIWTNVSAYDINLANITIILNGTLPLGGSYYDIQQSLFINISNTSFYYNFTGLDQGIYDLNIYAYDYAGHIINGTTLNYILDFGPPNITYNLPTLSSGINSTKNYISINVSADDPSYANLTVYVYDSSYTLINKTFSTSKNIDINTHILSDGLYYYNATAYDTNNNYSSLTTRNITLQYYQVNISTCRELNVPYTQYIITTDLLTTNGTCLNVSSPGADINCNGHSIIGDAAIEVNKIGAILRNCVVIGNNITTYALKVKGTSPADVTIYNSSFSGALYGIYMAPESKLSAYNISLLNNVYGIYFNNSVNGNVINTALFIGNINDSITIMGPDNNRFNNILMTTATDANNDGVIKLFNSTNNYISESNFITTADKLFNLSNHSVNNTLYHSFYNNSKEVIDGSSHLIRSWLFTGLVQDSAHNALGNAAINYIASIATNKTVNYSDGTQISYGYLKGTMITNSPGYGSSEIIQYMNIIGTIYPSTPYNFTASYLNFIPVNASISIVNNTDYTFTMSEEIKSNSLTRTAMWLILGLVFLIGMAASIGFFMVRMREGYSVVDIWKYFIILVIWLVIFTILFYVLAWFIMGSYYPQISTL